MVTGGCGFLGAALVSRLIEDGESVIVLDDQRLGTTANLEDRLPLDSLTFAVVNLEDSATTRRVMELYAPRVVFHLAALHFIPACNRDPHAAVRSNVAATQSLLDACVGLEGLEALVTASSAAVYTPGPGPHRESDPTLPIDIYGMTKLWNEQQVALFHKLRAGSVGVGAGRLFNIYGPGETNEHLIPAIIRQALAGGPLRLGNLDSRRDLVFVDDVADALVKLSEAVADGGLEICNVGSEVAYDGHRVVELVGEVLERELEVLTDPARLRASDRPDLLSDCSRARELLGWSAQTDFREGIARAAMLPLAPASV
jgi:UDP-glucose 4-epimerase